MILWERYRVATTESIKRIAGGIRNAVIRSGGENFLLTVNIALIRLKKHRELTNKPKQNVLSVTEACFLYEKQNFLLNSTLKGEEQWAVSIPEAGDH